MIQLNNNHDAMMDAIHETQVNLYNLHLSLDSSEIKFDEVKHEALLSRGRHLTSTECKFMKEALDKANEVCLANIEHLSSLSEIFDVAKIKLRKSLRFFNPDGPTNVTFHSGNPWELFLKPTPSQNKEIRQILEEMFKANTLESYTDPEQFDVVCVYGKNAFYRGLIMDIIHDTNQLTVLNIDRCYTSVVPIENIYELPSQLLDIPIQILKCSLLLPTFDNLKKFWTHDAANLLLLVLSESELSVTVTDIIIPEMPPIFTVEMIGKVDNIQININSWLLSTVLPMLSKWNNVPQDYKDVYALYPFSKNIFKQEKLEPAEKSINNKQCNDSEAVSSNITSVSAVNNSQYIDKSSKVTEKPIENDKLSLTTVKLESLSPIESITLPDVSNIAVINSPSISEQGSSKSVPTKKSRRIQSEEISPTKESFKSESVSPTESSPYGSNIAIVNSPCDSDPEVNRTSCDSANGVAMSNRHGEVIKHFDNKYIQQDEYCELFLRNKRCWRANCKKLHKHPSGKGTEDKMETFCAIYYRINLPKLFDEVTLTVIEISSANSFYAYLHTDYSDTEDLIVNDVSSLKILEKELNYMQNIQRYKSYTVNPLLGEILLFYDNTHGYRRAKLVEIFEQSAHIFLIDYGFYVTVPLSEIRKIEQQFLQLPAQAVYTTLENTVPIPEKAELAKSFLNYKIKGKVCLAKVFKRNVVDSKLSVEVYLTNLTLNQLLLEKGYCKFCES